MAKKSKNKYLITGKDSNGKNRTVAIIKPTPENTRQSQKVYNRTFRDALESGALLRQKLDTYMQEQGLWNEEKQKQYDKLVKNLNIIASRSGAGKNLMEIHIRTDASFKWHPND